MRRFELKVAWRHLLMSHGQTELTVGAVAVGVLLVVFLSSLINGLQIGLVEDVVGSIPHVTVEAATPGAKPLWQVQCDQQTVTRHPELVSGFERSGNPGTSTARHPELDSGSIPSPVTNLEKMSTRRKRIPDWERIQAAILQMPAVQAVSPSVEGDGMVTRGAKTVGARVTGIVPDEECKVVSIAKRVIEGDFSRVDEQNVAIGVKMATDLGVRLGSSLRVTSNQGVTQTFRVAAIFDLGVEQGNESVLYMGLQSAQAMFKIGKDITTLNVRGQRMYDAEGIADQVRGVTDLTVHSWMENNLAFLDSLRMQNTAAGVVQAMCLLASAFGVASVMIVFVVQKSKDIGILKSMGATRCQIRRIFILEGLGVGLGGAILGSGIGTGFCYLAKSLIIPGQMFGGKQATIVPMQFDMQYVLIATVVALGMGLISSVVPAHRASKLDPVEAIRRG